MECKFIWNDDAFKKPKRKRVLDNTFTIKYPSDRIRQQKFQNSEQVSTFLLRNALQIGICKWQIFEKTISDKGQYIDIMYSCKHNKNNQCDAQLVYRQNKLTPSKSNTNKEIQKKQYLTVVRINNYHRHIIKLTPKLANQENIRQYLFDLPVEQKFQNHVQIIKKKFNLSRLQATNLKERVFWRFKNEDHMLRKLTQRKVTFRRKIQNGKTILLLLISDTMRKNYLKYGDILCFDITYKLLMRKKDQTRHLGIGFFIGQDENARIIVFGVATIPIETSENFMTLFSFFFEVVQYIPQTILTDDQKALGIALQQLKQEQGYQYYHLLDWYHKMEAIKRAAKKQPYRQPLFTLFLRLLKQPSKQLFKDIAVEIASLLIRQEIMKQFLMNRSQYCLSYAPQAFFAFGISSTRAQAFNGLIKRSVPHQTNIGRLIYFVLRVEKRLNNRMAVLNYMHPQLIKFIDDPQILYLSNVLQYLSYQQVRQYYEESRQFQTLETGKSPQLRYIPYIKYERNYRFNLMYDIQYGCWRCQCKNNFRTGMPCSHIVCVVRHYGGCVGYYINQRWFHDKDNVQIRKASRPNIKTKKI